MTHTTEEYKGYTINIKYDSDPHNPRNDSNISKMICFHKRYNLGDDHEYRHEDYNGWDELEEQIKKDFKNNIILPLYLYDHSGITISTTPFGCRWDSGQVGFIIVDRKGLEECCGIKRITKKETDKIITWLEGEAESYDKYLRGEAYGYEIELDDELQDSCWGYDDVDYCMEDAKSIVDYYLKEKVA